MTRSLRYGLNAAALAVMMAAALASAPAAKHVHLVRTDPMADSTVRVLPRAIRLWFSAPVQISVTTVRLTGPDGIAVATAPAKMGEGLNAPVIAEVQCFLKPGRQSVAWRTMSRDGHAESGTFHFHIAAGAVAASR